MRGRIRSLALTAAAAVAFAGVGVLAGGGPTPPWESSISPAPAGAITFYNAQGQVITGGSITASGLGAFAAASTPASNVAYNKATLFVFTPVSGENPGLWSGEQISSSTTFPNTAAPGQLGTTANPVESNPGTDVTMQNYVAAFPNTQTAAGFVGLYDVRMKVTGAGLPALTTYYDTVISVTGNTWSVDFPDFTQNTTTTMTASPPSPQTSPASPVTLSATVAPASAGTVTFWAGATQVGATQTVTT